jgi:hypothetical protein
VELEENWAKILHSAFLNDHHQDEDGFVKNFEGKKYCHVIYGHLQKYQRNFNYFLAGIKLNLNIPEF